VLPFEAPPFDSTYRLFYRGPVGVSGVGVQQTWDLRVMPLDFRRILSFRDDWRVFVRQVDAGISDVDENIGFVDDANGFPVGMVLTLTAASPANLIAIEAWFLHSIIR
jgi:hypothetical protein